VLGLNAVPVSSQQLTDSPQVVSSQDALCLLRFSFSAPRVQHLVRCSPSVDNRTFDELLRTALGLCRITNCDLTDTQWLQASLTIRKGGLGVRQVDSLALPVFLASSANTRSLQAAILPSHFSHVDSVFQSYKDRLLTIFGHVPTGDSSHKQSAGDRPGLQSARDSVESSKSDP